MVVTSYFVPDKPDTERWQIESRREAEFLDLAQTGERPELVYLVNPEAEVEVKTFIDVWVGRMFVVDLKSGERLEYRGIYRTPSRRYRVIFEICTTQKMD